MSHDTQLKQSVLDELGWDPSVSAAHIGVTADNGAITLTGRVENYAEKQAAERAAFRVRGVKAVAEEIEVRLPFERKRGDSDIAAAALERLAWDVSVPDDTVRVKVENGWVTLTGDVDWFYQREAAAREVRGLIGVTGLSDQITIKEKVDTGLVSDNIMHALNRSWFFDEKTVGVTAEGGRVRLTGTVHSQHERQMAAQTAWAAPGATSVQNDISVV